MKYRSILLFGAPGSGKGTQGKTLGTLPGYFHVACGDVFRGLKLDTELGRTFVEYSSRGALVPDEFTVRLWREHIDSNMGARRFRPERDTLVLDGIPRNLTQAEILQDTLDVRVVFNLACPDRAALIDRLQKRALHENRIDDANLDVIRTRLDTYDRESTPVLDFYGPRLVREIDATQSPAEVLRDIMTLVATKP